MQKILIEEITKDIFSHDKVRSVTERAIIKWFNSAYKKRPLEMADISFVNGKSMTNMNITFTWRDTKYGFSPKYVSYVMKFEDGVETRKESRYYYSVVSSEHDNIEILSDCISSDFFSFGDEFCKVIEKLIQKLEHRE